MCRRVTTAGICGGKSGTAESGRVSLASVRPTSESTALRSRLRGCLSTACRVYLRGAAVPVSAGPERPIVHQLALRLVPCRNASTGIYETASCHERHRQLVKL